MSSEDSPASGNGRHVAVDRLEGDTAVVVDDAGRTRDVPTRQLPIPVREGMVLFVSDGPDGTPDWSTARSDEEEQTRRLKDLDARVTRLSRDDDGQDVAL